MIAQVSTRAILSGGMGLLLALSLPGCSSNPAGTRTLGDNDGGSRVSLAPGQLLDVALSANPTTGFTWEVSHVDASVLKQSGEPTYTPESNLIGAGGTLVLHFQAVGAGQTELVLMYHRPFEKNSPPLKTYQVTVNVSAP